MIDKSIRQKTILFINDEKLFDASCNAFRNQEGIVAVATTISTQIKDGDLVFIATIFYRVE